MQYLLSLLLLTKLFNQLIQTYEEITTSLFAIVVGICNTSHGTAAGDIRTGYRFR